MKDNRTKMIEEHKTLVNVLLHGTKEQRKNEAFKQLKELKGYMKEVNSSKTSKKIDKKTLLGIKGLV
jgi:hypothetical protein